MNIIKPFISKTAYDFINTTNHSFTDAEMATIIYHSSATLREKLGSLKEISEKTEDMKLRKEIKERILYEKKCYGLFNDKDKIKCFYQLVLGGDDIGYYETAVLAIESGKQHNKPFSVKKYQIVGVGDKPIIAGGQFNPRLFKNSEIVYENYFGDPIGDCDYTATGELLEIWSAEIDYEETKKVDDWGETRFESMFLNLPNPFEQGDIVECDGNVGVVVITHKDWLDFTKGVKEKNTIVDFSDASIVVDILNIENSELSHLHLSPVFLEKITDDDKLRDVIRKKVIEEYDVVSEKNERLVEIETNEHLYHLKRVSERYKIHTDDRCDNENFCNARF